ncbi:MAG: hypothetical protein H6701_06850 [Myxococcales bacterium]|nr:hypothetical protein [Myxococcales bacterium]MCB9550829.1 hypothetical protein [Myxococcales bacterium]
MRARGLLLLWGLLAGCGPTIIEKRVIEAPPPEVLRPKPSPEEAAGSVPPLVDILPAVPLVPAGFVAPAAPDDPRPVVLLEAAAGEAAVESEAGEAPVESEAPAESEAAADGEAGDG